LLLLGIPFISLAVFIAASRRNRVPRVVPHPRAASPSASGRPDGRGVELHRQEPQAPIGDIIVRSGFDSPSNYYKAKRKYGEE